MSKHNFAVRKACLKTGFLKNGGKTLVFNNNNKERQSTLKLTTSVPGTYRITLSVPGIYRIIYSVCAWHLQDHLRLCPASTGSFTSVPGIYRTISLAIFSQSGTVVVSSYPNWRGMSKLKTSSAAPLTCGICSINNEWCCRTQCQ